MLRARGSALAGRDRRPARAGRPKAVTLRLETPFRHGGRLCRAGAQTRNARKASLRRRCPTINGRWRMTGVYFLAFSLSGPESSPAPRLATAAQQIEAVWAT